MYDHPERLLYAVVASLALWAWIIWLGVRLYERI